MTNQPNQQVFYTQSTTDGEVLYYVSTGNGTGDVSVITRRSTDRLICCCTDDIICKHCQERFYKKVFSTNLL